MSVVRHRNQYLQEPNCQHLWSEKNKLQQGNGLQLAYILYKLGDSLL